MNVGRVTSVTKMRRVVRGGVMRCCGAGVRDHPYTKWPGLQEPFNTRPETFGGRIGTHEADPDNEGWDAKVTILARTCTLARKLMIAGGTRFRLSLGVWFYFPA